jgi:hypothetical protein
MPAPATRCLCAIAVGFASWFSATASPAAAEGATEGSKRAVALLVPPGGRRGVESLLVAAGSGVVDLGVTLFVLEAGPPQDPAEPFAVRARELAVSAGAFAAVWVDPAQGGTVYAVAADGVPEGVIARSVGEVDPDAQVEAMAVIIRTAIEQIIAAQAPATPEPPEAPKPEPIARPAEPAPPARTPIAAALEKARRDPVGLTQEVEYAMHCASRGLGAVHGVNLRVGASLPHGFAVYAGYTLLSPAAADAAHASVEVTRHPLHVGAKLRLGDGFVRGFAETNLIIDYAVPRLSSLEPALVAEDAESSVQVSALLVAGIGLRVHAVATLFAGAGAEIPFNPVRYVLGSGDREIVVADPWPVQPWVLAGLILDLL